MMVRAYGIHLIPYVVAAVREARESGGAKMRLFRSDRIRELLQDSRIRRMFDWGQSSHYDARCTGCQLQEVRCCSEPPRRCA